MHQQRLRSTLGPNLLLKLFGVQTEEALPTLRASEDFEGTETLLRAELAEGWQAPKGKRE